MNEEIFPFIFVIAALLVIGGVFLSAHLEEKFRQRKESLRQINRLYRCTSCKKYSRHYYAKLKNDHYGHIHVIDWKWDSICCPHCREAEAKSASTNEKWVKTHVHSPAITRRSYKQYLKEMNHLSQLIYERQVKDYDTPIGSIDEEFESLLLALSRRPS